MFDRPGGPRPVELTPLGKLVLGHARDVIAHVDATGEAVERFLAGEVGRIDVGTFQSVSNVLLPAIVRRLRGEYPDLDIRLFEHEDTDAGRGRARRRARPDVHRRPATGDLESLLLLDDPFVLVARPASWRRGRTRAASSTARPLVGYPPACARRRSRTGCGPAAPTRRSSSGPTTTAPRWPWCAPAWAGR